MSYTKQTWQTGETITANKLNHMEDGIANNNVMIVRIADETEDTFIYDKTWQEVTNALKNGIPVYILEATEEVEEQNTYFKPIIGSEIATTGSSPYKIYYIPISYPNISIGRLQVDSADSTLRWQHSEAIV